MNPIVQDKENNHLRYVPNVFPWHGHVCNYGAFPQTWENPFHADEWTGLKGDKDPIDVCEVGSKPVATGTVLPVKVSEEMVASTRLTCVTAGAGDPWAAGRGGDGLEGDRDEQCGGREGEYQQPG